MEWLITGSAAHTMVMGDAMAAFPDAKVVGPEFCQEKFKFAKQLKKVKYQEECRKETEVRQVNYWSK